MLLTPNSSLQLLQDKPLPPYPSTSSLIFLLFLSFLQYTLTSICVVHILLIMQPPVRSVIDLLEATFLKNLTPFHFPRSYRLSIAPQLGVGALEPFPLYSTILTGLLLYSSCIKTTTVAEFMSVAIYLMGKLRHGKIVWRITNSSACINLRLTESSYF